jgi:probable rRNA maturation factor
MTSNGLDVSVTVDEQAAMPDGYSAEDVHRVVASTLRAVGAGGAWDISIVFAGDDELQRLHRDYLNDDTPTDIMTFPNEPDDGEWFGGESGASGGDIAISVDRASEQCVDEGWDASRELLFLVAHGVLHLLGWDDSTPESRVAMLDRQREILRDLQLT